MTSICSTAAHAITFCDWPISWSATGDFLSGVGTVVGAIAVIYAANKGASTFKLWRQQRLEERRIVLAEEILTLVHQLEGAFVTIRQHLRNPGETEIADRIVSESITEVGHHDRYDNAIRGNITIQRIARYDDLFKRLAELRPTSRAVFGGSVETKLAAFDQIHRTIRVAAHGLTQVGAPDEADGAMKLAHLGLAQMYSRVTTEQPVEEKDETRDALNAAIRAIEAEMRPYMDDVEQSDDSVLTVLETAIEVASRVMPGGTLGAAVFDAVRSRRKKD